MPPPSVFWMGLKFLWMELLKTKMTVTVWESCHEIVFVMWTTVSGTFISLLSSSCRSTGGNSGKLSPDSSQLSSRVAETGGRSVDTALFSLSLHLQVTGQNRTPCWHFRLDSHFLLFYALWRRFPFIDAWHSWVECSCEETRPGHKRLELLVWLEQDQIQWNKCQVLYWVWGWGCSKAGCGWPALAAENAKKSCSSDSTVTHHESAAGPSLPSVWWGIPARARSLVALLKHLY